MAFVYRDQVMDLGADMGRPGYSAATLKNNPAASVQGNAAGLAYLMGEVQN